MFLISDSFSYRFFFARWLHKLMSNYSGIFVANMATNLDKHYFDYILFQM